MCECGTFSIDSIAMNSVNKTIKNVREKIQSGKKEHHCGCKIGCPFSPVPKFLVLSVFVQLAMQYKVRHVYEKCQIIVVIYERKKKQLEIFSTAC